MPQANYQQAPVQRESRVKTMLPARMRSQAGWSDACILNVSSRGLMVYSNGTAQPGSFVEIRRGSQLVVARVVWRKNGRMGLWSPDKVHVHEILSDSGVAAVVQSTAAAVERRRIPRTQDQSRARARAMEFLTTVLIATGLAGWAVLYVHEVMARPMTVVRATLGGS